MPCGEPDLREGAIWRKQKRPKGQVRERSHACKKKVTSQIATLDGCVNAGNAGRKKTLPANRRAAKASADLPIH